MTTTADRLRALAAAATPGPWEFDGLDACSAFAAALSPERVLALADLVEAAQNTLDEPCICEPDWTERGMHSPRCFWVAVRDYDLDGALARVEEAFR